MPKGYYEKYLVHKLDDPTRAHMDCEFFVLDMTHDVHALNAIKYYADAVRESNPELARDLDERIMRYCTCIDISVMRAHNCPIHGVH